MPAADLDVALQAQAACMRGIEDSEEEWDHERGAIEQEVPRDLSNPIYKFIDRLNGEMFAGTPYSHDPLGTRPSFDATTGAMLKDFYNKWYAPEHDPADGGRRRSRSHDGQNQSNSTETFPTIPCPSTCHQSAPFAPQTFSLDSNLPYVSASSLIGSQALIRPTTLPAQILSDVLGSQRADLYGMVPARQGAGAAEFGLSENYRKASVGFGVVALPASTDRPRRWTRCGRF